MSEGSRFSRRAFLLGTSGLIALASSGMAALDWERLRRRWIARKLERHFPYLDLDADGVRRFVELYESHRGIIEKNPWKMLSRPLPDDVCTRYLASTDFFLHGADEARNVRFVAFYDPYVSPCYNPFRATL